MKDYKDTLNLPKTSFPMKANLPQKEPAVLQNWQELDLNQKRSDARSGRDKFILHDGPPYANGKLHMGHALNKILKDIVIKSRALNGLDTPYVPGWDCHGLPIEINVEKKVGKAGVKVSKEEFYEACRDYASRQVELQKQGFVRLGVIGEWENPYLTMNHKYEADIVRALGKIIENGHLAHGFKPVHWCTACGSALAEAEVEYKDKESPAIDVAFSVVECDKFAACCNIKLDAKKTIIVPIWTTTPWTLPANQAVALHPEYNYFLVELPGKYLLVAENLFEDMLDRYAIDDGKIVDKIIGAKLENILLQHPFLDRQVPIVLGEHVTQENGTGAVHTAPGHGQDDYLIGVEYGLPIDNPVENNGCFRDDLPFFGGEHVFKVNDKVIELLKERGNLLCYAKLLHSYPHCWRHKTPVIFRATPQWFISMDKNALRAKALDEIEKVRWLPGWGKARIKSMIENRPDWCISRQRLWGTPMPLFIHKKTGELHPNTMDIIEQVALKIEQHGIEVWQDLSGEDLLGSDAANYEKVLDTLDVWFDSGVSHNCVLKERANLDVPADLYLEGSDQHRGWFQSSLLTSVAMWGHAPYKTVLTHGFVVDAKGHKMSKSLGNVIEVETLIKKYGADIARLWVAATDYSAELSLSDEGMKRVADSYRRIRNTIRFLLANLHDFDSSKHMVAPDNMLALDRAIVKRSENLQQELKDAYDEYQFHLIYQKVHSFCSIELGGFYLDIIKDRQYTMQTDSVGRRSAQTAIYYILQAMVRWIAPVLSFTAEETWSYLPEPKAASVMLATWYKDFPVFNADNAMDQEFWQKIIYLRGEVNKELEKQRSLGYIGSALEAEVTLYCDEHWLNILSLLGGELRFVLITADAKVQLLADKDQRAVASADGGLWIKVVASNANKCVRCWQYRNDVGENKEHPELCSRCVANVDGDGELRRFA
ncbi:MAG: isoleucine--tRNA ligase [Gammaproteobacteria bacterium]|nr:isoleucine--tRNA ligase [Gammaproteobacteria bacterium]